MQLYLRPLRIISFIFWRSASISGSAKAASSVLTLLMFALVPREGWAVGSIEAERCGYDLRCTQGDQERHMELKGTPGDQPAFIFTAQELRCANEDKAFELWVV